MYCTVQSVLCIILLFCMYCTVQCVFEPNSSVCIHCIVIHAPISYLLFCLYCIDSCVPHSPLFSVQCVLYPLYKYPPPPGPFCSSCIVQCVVYPMSTLFLTLHANNSDGSGPILRPNWACLGLFSGISPAHIQAKCLLTLRQIAPIYYPVTITFYNLRYDQLKIIFRCFKRKRCKE